MAIITTPGASDANSYETLAGIAAYCAAHPFGSAWAATAAPAQEQVARLATQLLDVMPGAWSGAATLSTQALGFPRTGMVSRNGFAIGSMTIPRELKTAQSEWSRQLAILYAAGSDPTETDELVKLGLTSAKLGPMAVQFREPPSQQDIATPSVRALAGVVPDAVKLIIPSSWLVSVTDQQEDEMMPVIILNL